MCCEGNRWFSSMSRLSSQALEKYNIEKDIAAFIKKEFDKKYNPTWHCIVGRNFGEERHGDMQLCRSYLAVAACLTGSLPIHPTLQGHM
jgi:hypothetical protein